MARNQHFYFFGGLCLGLFIACIAIGNFLFALLCLAQSLFFLATALRTEKVAMALLALFLLASPAGANDMIWTGFVDRPPATFPATLRVSISESAYVELTANNSLDFHIFRPTDGGATAAFFAALVNGTNDPLTWTGPDFSHTVDENHFFGGRTSPPVVGINRYPEVLAGKTDLIGWNLTEIVLNMGDELNGGPVTRFRASVHGMAPEPSAAIMLCVGCAHGLMASSFRRRRPLTAR